MKSNLAADPEAGQLMAAATIDKLKTVSGADPIAGKFAADTFNKNLIQLNPKLGDLVGDDAANQLGAVGRTAKITAIQPAGHYVNNSNSLTAAASDVGKSIVRGAIALKTGGASEVGMKLADIIGSNKATKAANSPYGGMGTPNQ